MTEPPLADAVPTGAVPTSRTFEAFCARDGERLAKALALALDHRELGRDAAAEAMTRAWERWAKVGGYDNVAGWCYRVGLNWGRSRLRRRRREVSTVFVPEVAHTDRPDDGTMLVALAKLSSDHRAVVVGRFYLDWSEAELADALDIPTDRRMVTYPRGLSACS